MGLLSAYAGPSLCIVTSGPLVSRSTLRKMNPSSPDADRSMETEQWAHTIHDVQGLKNDIQYPLDTARLCNPYSRSKLSDILCSFLHP
mmetsp:Transcript_13676/g.33456  ORF Transcript_13676/g.33456 Transcript_13676/m.33456 type:complete len:88 (-) Transcript_13676:513-776(-)